MNKALAMYSNDQHGCSACCVPDPPFTVGFTDWPRLSEGGTRIAAPCTVRRLGCRDGRATAQGLREGSGLKPRPPGSQGCTLRLGILHALTQLIIPPTL